MNTIKSVAVPAPAPKRRKSARTQEEYVPIAVKDPTSAMKAFYHLFMGHSIDFCEIMLDVLSEKYEISRADMLEVVMGDDRITKMLRHPILDTLGYFTEDELSKTFEKLSTKEPVAVAEAQTQPQPQQKPIRIKKPKPTQTSSDMSNPPAPESIQVGHLPSQGNPQ
jgi:hypothetical protein